MAKPKQLYGDNVIVRPSGTTKTWARTNGDYIAGRAYLDGADETACEMEAKWGADRLRLLVSAELREKFDRQRYLLNQAIWHGELEDVRRESGRMVNALYALDRAAEAAGASKLAPVVWEVAIGGGDRVAAIVRSDHDATAVNAEGRKVAVYTLEEIGRLLAAYPNIAQAKAVFPGAAITEIRKTVEDPLKAIPDTGDDLNDEIGF
jgi:hypothetical protein